MPASGHGCPALQIADSCCPLPWWTDNLTRECCYGRWHSDTLTRPQAPRPMTHLIVEPERAIDRLRHPVQHNIGEQGIFTHPPFEVALSVCPGIELFDDPGGQPAWGVVQGVRQRLRSG